MPALSAIRYIPQVKAFYLHLTDGLGKKKMQATCAELVEAFVPSLALSAVEGCVNCYTHCTAF